MRREPGEREYVIKNQKKLRCGLTTGTCAAAAAKAATRLLLFGSMSEKEEILTAKGVRFVPVFLVEDRRERAECRVRKDSGDDPDVTNQADIHVIVEKISGLNSPREEETLRKKRFSSETYPHLFLDGGAGVGRITRKGFEQEIGYAAINRIPREMIFQAVGEVCERADCREDLLITVHVPRGEELAKRTLNPGLGIEGGISILGTTGILEPMSERALIDTIRLEIEQRRAEGRKMLLAVPGNYGRNYLKNELDLDTAESVKCGNYIGETIDLAAACGMEDFLLVGNLGKLVKLAAGIMNTHSKTADGRCEIFAVHTVLCGGSRGMAERMMECNNTEEILAYLEEWGLRSLVLESICQKIGEHGNRRAGDNMRFGAVLFSERFGLLGFAGDAQRMLKIWNERRERE